MTFIKIVIMMETKEYLNSYLLSLVGAKQLPKSSHVRTSLIDNEFDKTRTQFDSKIQYTF